MLILREIIKKRVLARAWFTPNSLSKIGRRGEKSPRPIKFINIVRVRRKIGLK